MDLGPNANSRERSQSVFRGEAVRDPKVDGRRLVLPLAARHGARRPQPVEVALGEPTRVGKRHGEEIDRRVFL